MPESHFFTRESVTSSRTPPSTSAIVPLSTIVPRLHIPPFPQLPLPLISSDGDVEASLCPLLLDLARARGDDASARGDVLALHPTTAPLPLSAWPRGFLSLPGAWSGPACGPRVRPCANRRGRPVATHKQSRPPSRSFPYCSYSSNPGSRAPPAGQAPNPRHHSPRRRKGRRRDKGAYTPLCPPTCVSRRKRHRRPLRPGFLSFVLLSPHTRSCCTASIRSTPSPYTPATSRLARCRGTGSRSG
mmetsp:Transcript_3870/g.9415  ORF Transcript_3870/g.9415 Transcript_3870/m.9415 type:complete len:244 (-) Transcript_3870:2870-3601(-)